MNHPKSTLGEKRSHLQGRSLAVGVILLVLLLTNLLVIFCFSSADRKESGEMSAGVTRYLLEHIYPDYDDMSSADREALLQKTHKFVRKAAHFSEFALLGFLSAGLLLWVSDHLYSMNPWKTWLYPAAFTLLYAASDEIHQIFTNRGPRFTDVLIDFVGALFGILLIHGGVGLISRCRKGKDPAETDEKEA